MHNPRFSHCEPPVNTSLTRVVGRATGAQYIAGTWRSATQTLKQRTDGASVSPYLYLSVWKFDQMKILLLLFLFSTSLFATTRIQETQLEDPGGRKVQTGSAKICPAATFAAGSSTVLLKQCAIFPISAGNFVANLIPTDISTSSQYYRVTWTTPSGSWSEVWLVPTSGGTLRISDVLVTTTVNPVYLGNGAYCITVLNGHWSVVTCPSSGSGSWSSMTSSSWSGLTSSGWSSITP